MSGWHSWTCCARVSRARIHRKALPIAPLSSVIEGRHPSPPDLREEGESGRRGGCLPLRDIDALGKKPDGEQEDGEDLRRLEYPSRDCWEQHEGERSEDETGTTDDQHDAEQTRQELRPKHEVPDADGSYSIERERH